MKHLNQALLTVTVSVLLASGLAKTAIAQGKTTPVVTATENDSLVVGKASNGDGKTKDDWRHLEDVLKIATATRTAP